MNEKETTPPSPPQTDAQPRQPWYEVFLKAAISFVGRLVRITAAFSLVCCLLVYYERHFDSGLVIDEFAVPATFQAQGYTSDVFAREVLDQLYQIQFPVHVPSLVNSNAVDGPPSSPSNSAQSLPPIPSKSKELVLNLTVPKVNVAVRSVLLFFHSMLGFPIASGEITTVSCTDQARGDEAQSKRGKKPPRDPKALCMDIMLRVQPKPKAVPIKDPPEGQDVSIRLQPTKTEISEFIKIKNEDPRNAIELVARELCVPSGENDRADVYNNASNALANEQNVESIHKSYTQAIEVSIKPESKAEVYLNWGNALFYRDEYKEAIAKYELANSFQPEDADVLYNWGVALRAKAALDADKDKEKDLADAVDKFKDAYDLRGAYPKNKRETYGIGYCFALKAATKPIPDSLNCANATPAKTASPIATASPTSTSSRTPSGTPTPAATLTSTATPNN